MGPNFLPKIFNSAVIDHYIPMDFDSAVAASRKIAKEEGLLVGISAGANIEATRQVALQHKDQEKIIVTILCDTGERYLSTSLYEYDEEGD